MLMPPCRIVLFDCTDNALLAVNAPDGRLLFRRMLPTTCRPLALFAAEDKRILLITTTATDSVLYVWQSESGELMRLPHILPPISAASPSADGRMLFLSSVRRTLYRLELASGKLTALGSAPHECIGLADSGDHLFAVWETEGGSICSIHNTDGGLLAEHRLAGTIPSLCLAGNTLCLPFTGGQDKGDGLHLLGIEPPFPLETISLRPPELRGLSVDPYSVLPQGDLLCLVSESSGTITKIDRRTRRIIGSYALGRSISRLHLLPDDRFAVASSNMFADLTLLDLVNERLLSVSICPHELFHHIVVLPPA